MHRKIGIIGGLSPESTASYYLHITHTYTERFGDAGYPEIIIFSVNFKQYIAWKNHGRWDLIAENLVRAAKGLQAAGAELGLIATNTMHKVFDQVNDSVDFPMIHIVDPTAKQAGELGLRTLGLLGTDFTMQDGFYQERLSRSGLETLVPDIESQNTVHRIIMEELTQGRFLNQSKENLIQIIQGLIKRGAEGIVLGCTEIPLIIKQQDISMPVLDTAVLHAEAALEAAAGQSEAVS